MPRIICFSLVCNHYLCFLHCRWKKARQSLWSQTLWTKLKMGAVLLTMSLWRYPCGAQSTRGSEKFFPLSMASYRIQFSRQIVGLEANPGVMNVSVTFLGFLASLSIEVNGSVSQEDLTFRTRRSTMKLDSRYCMIVSGYAPNLFL